MDTLIFRESIGDRRISTDVQAIRFEDVDELTLFYEVEQLKQVIQPNVPSDADAEISV